MAQQEPLRIKLNTWFRLPSLGKLTFSELMRAGMTYDSKNGFMVTERSNLSAIKGILERTLKRSVFYAYNCVICGKETDCSTCSFRYMCPVEEAGGHCICDKCYAEKGLMDYFAAQRYLLSGERGG